uniref:Uncharacterized protein n=1 Tax=Oryza sativa subsp. japonica TaxID=39947 RepID=Q7XDX4_ORYSJ|nr:hypothetical protein LOC_Os10g31070 [Oryza sativa Japonica Group]
MGGAGRSRAEDGELDVPPAESGLGQDVADDGVIEGGHEGVGDGGLVGARGHRCSSSDPTTSPAGARERIARLAPLPGHRTPVPLPYVGAAAQLSSSSARLRPDTSALLSAARHRTGQTRTSVVTPCRRPPWPPVSLHHVAPTSPHCTSEAAEPFSAKSMGREKEGKIKGQSGHLEKCLTSFDPEIIK